MFCPNCGTENLEEMAYCRSCGDDLKIISQAMKKNLAVAIVSKLDAVIENESERLRRDAIFAGFGGVIGTILVIFLSSSIGSVETIVIIIFAALFLLSGIWSYLLYSRMRELETKSLNMPVGGPFSFLDDSQGKEPRNVNEVTAKKLSTESDSQERLVSIHCPRCGVQNSENVPYCRSCGCSLDLSPSPQGLERYLPTFLVNKLDYAITKYKEMTITQHKELTPFKNHWVILAVAAVFIYLAITSGLESEWAGMTISLFFVVSTLVTGTWDYVAYRRRLEKDEESLDTRPVSSFSDLKAFAKYTVAFLLLLIVSSGFVLLISLLLGLLAGLISFASVLCVFLVAVILMTYKYYSPKRDGLQENVSALTASELQNENESEAGTAELGAETQRQLTPIDSESESTTTRELVDGQRTETETKRLSELPKETKLE